MRRLRAAAIALACLAVAWAAAGCVSMPLATLWELRSFGADDLAAIDPAEVRVATLVEPDVGNIDPARSHLKLTLTPHDGPAEVHAFGLRPARLLDGTLVPANDPRWAVFELDAAGLAAMRALEPRLARIEDDYRAWSLTVTAQGFDAMAKQVDVLYFSVRVQLGHDQAPITLFDRARIEMER